MKKWICLIVLVAFGAFLFFLPQLGSSPMGKALFIRLLENNIHGKAQIDALHFSWKGPQTFQQIQFTTPDIQGSIAELTQEAPFWSFLNSKGALSLKNTSLTFPRYPGVQIQQKELQAELSEHAFLLKQPLVLSIQITPELSSTLLREVNPLFLTGVSAKNPLLLQISSTDFSCPLHPFSLKKLRLNGSLDMGQVECKNGKSLSSILQFLKTPSSQQMTIWFTPVDFQIEKGILHTGRMDALISRSVHICTWGQIDLLKDSLDMSLGLTADTLQRSFGVTGLSDNYVLSIPIKGSTKDPEFVTGPATAKIAAMLGTQQIANTKKGRVFGSVLNTFSKISNDSDVPPPKRPFPWEK